MGIILYIVFATPNTWRKKKFFFFANFYSDIAINQLFRFRVRFNLWNCGKQLRKARENIWTWVVSHVNPGKVIEILSKKCYKWKSSRVFILNVNLDVLLLNVFFRQWMTLLLFSGKQLSYLQGSTQTNICNILSPLCSTYVQQIALQCLKLWIYF